jgi:hypothetical protein
MEETMKAKFLLALVLVVFFLAEVGFAGSLQVGRFQIIHAKWECIVIDGDRQGKQSQATDLILLDTATGQTWRLKHFAEYSGEFERCWEPFIWSRDKQGNYQYYPTPLEQIRLLKQPEPVEK